MGALEEDGVHLAAGGRGSEVRVELAALAPATQWTGKLSLKSGFWEKWLPGSMWWSRVATMY